MTVYAFSAAYSPPPPPAGDGIPAVPFAPGPQHSALTVVPDRFRGAVHVFDCPGPIVQVTCRSDVADVYGPARLSGSNRPSELSRTIEHVPAWYCHSGPCSRVTGRFTCTL